MILSEFARLIQVDAIDQYVMRRPAALKCYLDLREARVAQLEALVKLLGAAHGGDATLQTQDDHWGVVSAEAGKRVDDLSGHYQLEIAGWEKHKYESVTSDGLNRLHEIDDAQNAVQCAGDECVRSFKAGNWALFFRHAGDFETRRERFTALLDSCRREFFSVTN